MHGTAVQIPKREGTFETLKLSDFPVYLKTQSLPKSTTMSAANNIGVWCIETESIKSIHQPAHSLPQTLHACRTARVGRLVHDWRVFGQVWVVTAGRPVGAVTVRDPNRGTRAVAKTRTCAGRPIRFGTLWTAAV